MGITYDTPPPSILSQHRRLITARHLSMNGVLCVLWGEDALSFAHDVPTLLFTQQLLVPDALVPLALGLLQQEYHYRRTVQQDNIFDPSFDDSEGTWPDVVRMEQDRNARIAEFVSIVPQSYFAIDAEGNTEDFVFLVPPLDADYARIRVPRWHVFLEALLHAMVFPKSGRMNFQLKLYLGILMEYLVLYRLQPYFDVAVPATSPFNHKELRALEEIKDPATKFWLEATLRGTRPPLAKLRALARPRTSTVTQR